MHLEKANKKERKKKKENKKFGRLIDFTSRKIHPLLPLIPILPFLLSTRMHISQENLQLKTMKYHHAMNQSMYVLFVSVNIACTTCLLPCSVSHDY